jgi:hypothetical protein
MEYTIDRGCDVGRILPDYEFSFVVLYSLVFLISAALVTPCGGGWIRHDMLAVVRIGDFYAISAVALNASVHETVLLGGGFVDRRRHTSRATGAQDRSAYEPYSPVETIDRCLATIDILRTRGIPAKLECGGGVAGVAGSDGDGDGDGLRVRVRTMIRTAGTSVDDAASSVGWEGGGRAGGAATAGILVVLGTSAGMVVRRR